MPVTQTNPVCISPQTFLCPRIFSSTIFAEVLSHFLSVVPPCSAKAEILTFGVASGNLLFSLPV